MNYYLKHLLWGLLESIFVILFFIIILTSGILVELNFSILYWPIITLSTLLLNRTLKRFFPQHWSFKKRLFTTWSVTIFFLTICYFLSNLVDLKRKDFRFSQRFGNCAGHLRVLFQNPLTSSIGHKILQMTPYSFQYFNYDFEDFCRILKIRPILDSPELYFKTCDKRWRQQCLQEIYINAGQIFPIRSTGTALFMSIVANDIYNRSHERVSHNPEIKKDLKFQLERAIELIEYYQFTKNELQKNGRIEKIFNSITFPQNTSFLDFDTKLSHINQNDKFYFFVKNLFFSRGDRALYILRKMDDHIINDYFRISEEKLKKLKEALLKSIESNKNKGEVDSPEIVNLREHLSKFTFTFTN